MRGSYGNRKTTFIISLLIILLCLTFIVGITLALFTSDAGDGTIGINTTTGKVKVDIIDENENSLVGDVLHFIDADGDGEMLFEPGATFFTEGFKVKNIGSIPVNFRAYISNDEDEAMDSFDKAFDLWIATDPYDLNTYSNLLEFTGRLEVDQSSDVYYLIVSMKKSAGNEFKNKVYSGIGITVYAVQGNLDIE